MISDHIPNTLEGTSIKIHKYYQGMETDKKIAEKLCEGNKDDVLLANVIKMYHKSNCL